MWELLIPLASAGIEAYQAYKQKPERREYKLSPYEQMVIDQLMREYRGGLPGWLTAPYHGEARKLEHAYSKHPGLFGVLSGIKSRDIYGPMAEAGKRYKTDLMSTIGGLTRGTGETVFTEPKDYSSALFDLGYALMGMGGLGRGTTGKGGGGIMPGSFKQKFSLNYPYLYQDEEKDREKRGTMPESFRRKFSLIR